MIIHFERVATTQEYEGRVWQQWRGAGDDGKTAIYVLWWKPSVAEVLRDMFGAPEIFSIVGVPDYDFLDGKDYAILWLKLYANNTKVLDSGKRAWLEDIHGLQVEV